MEPSSRRRRRSLKRAMSCECGKDNLQFESLMEKTFHHEMRRSPIFSFHSLIQFSIRIQQHNELLRSEDPHQCEPYKIMIRNAL